VLLSVDGKSVDHTQELVPLVRAGRPGKPMALRIFRAGREMTLTARPQPSADAKAADAKAAPARPAPPPAQAEAAAPASGAPPLGDYGCTHISPIGISGQWRTELKGSFKLMPGNQYRYLDGGEVGRYTYDPATGKLHFKGGYFGNTDAVGEYIPRDKSAQINIIFATKTPLSWTCGQSR
jgi:hypothetical protein